MDYRLMTWVSVIALSFQVAFCASSIASRSGDRVALLMLYHSVPALHSGWEVAGDHCYWSGITCINGRVTQIRLRSLALSGEVPLGFFGLLDMLDFFDMGDNRISGIIPLDVGDAVQLETFDMSQNTLTGRIPPSLTSLRRLRYFDISYNKVRGDLPAFLYAYVGVFKVTSNHLVGRIPKCFSHQPLHYFLGNWLCDQPMPPCPTTPKRPIQSQSPRQAVLVRVGVPVGIVVLLVISVGLRFAYLRRIKEHSTRYTLPTTCHPTLADRLSNRAEVRITVANVPASPPGSPLTPSPTTAREISTDKAVAHNFGTSMPYSPSAASSPAEAAEGSLISSLPYSTPSPHALLKPTASGLIQRKHSDGHFQKSRSEDLLSRFSKTPNTRLLPRTDPPFIGKCMPFQTRNKLEEIPLLKMHEA